MSIPTEMLVFLVLLFCGFLVLFVLVSIAHAIIEPWRKSPKTDEQAKEERKKRTKTVGLILVCFLGVIFLELFVGSKFVDSADSNSLLNKIFDVTLAVTLISFCIFLPSSFIFLLYLRIDETIRESDKREYKSMLSVIEKALRSPGKRGLSRLKKEEALDKLTTSNSWILSHIVLILGAKILLIFIFNCEWRAFRTGEAYGKGFAIVAATVLVHLALKGLKQSKDKTDNSKED